MFTSAASCDDREVGEAAMVFGGYGRKTKVRGEVFFPCMRCEQLNPFGLVENYGYGQLYGVRLAKFKTNRLLLCAHCQDGHGLEKDQWELALEHARQLKERGYEAMDMRQIATSAVDLAHSIFPDIAEDVRVLLSEQLGEAPPAELEGPTELPRAALEARADDVKVCPECAETIKAAARRCRFCNYRFDASDLPFHDGYDAFSAGAVSEERQGGSEHAEAAGQDLADQEGSAVIDVGVLSASLEAREALTRARSSLDRGGGNGGWLALQSLRKALDGAGSDPGFLKDVKGTASDLAAAYPALMNEADEIVVAARQRMSSAT